VSGTTSDTDLDHLARAVVTPPLPSPAHPRRHHSGSAAPPAPVPSGPEPTAPTAFRIASFNVLGSHLTASGGGKPGFGPGPVRMARGLAKIEASGASVVVLNEFESQAASVVEADGDWELHRATPNNRFRDGNTNGNAIAWRSDTWSEVAADEFTVPWQVTLHMPVVTLEHRGTGARITVVGVHNPASTPKAGNQSGARVVARRTELARVAGLRAADPSTPVLVAGDFNERADVYCSFLGAGLQSSAPRPAGAGCHAPGHSVDWVFGSTGLSFGGEVVDRSTLGTISDHPLLTASVSLPSQLR
jgi:endonuclease/exonuclease/phosphatase family metal-dependent hydrolase